jgi:hypothetical protein
MAAGRQLSITKTSVTENKRPASTIGINNKIVWTFWDSAHTYSTGMNEMSIGFN